MREISTLGRFLAILTTMSNKVRITIQRRMAMDELWRFNQLITLAETGNYRRAADKLGITHGALSQTVARFEAQYETQLFERQKRATVPTAYGERLLKAARQSVEVVSQAKRDISLMQNLKLGRLVMGVDTSIAEGLLAPALAALLDKFPELQFTAMVRNWRTMEQDLLADKIDIYVGLTPDRKSDRFDYREFELIPPVFACRAGHPLLDQPEFGIQDLIRFPFGGSDVPDWFLQQFVEAFPEQFKSIKSLHEVFLTTHELGLMRQLLSSTDIIGLVPEAVIRTEIAAGKICVLAKGESLYPMHVTGAVVTRDDRSLPPAAIRLSAMITDMAIAGLQNYRAQA
ncbi:MAG: LysR family transcriptional regulator [Sphingomonadales bacterium]|jgi:DNA-binding transcriptional LysR family regulator|nr:LysR family transcriptional regulator [Sphingomonadales bacterium]